jgi:hypothetical protein
LVFRIEPDVPQPPCWRTAHFDAVKVINATGDFNQRPKAVTGRMRGLGTYYVQPGQFTILKVAPGRYFAPGMHCLTASSYPGSCLDVWIDPSSR